MTGGRVPPEDPSILGSLFDVPARLEEEVPWLRGLAVQYTINRVPYVADFLGGSQQYRAAGLIFSQSCNDFSDLLRDLGEGSGRSAIRAARALIEHAVNFVDVISERDSAGRYIDHLSFVHELQFDLKVGVERMPAGKRRSYLHRLSKAAREARADVERAIGRYGAAFRRQWAASNLFDRADKYGLSDLYGFYRLASLVMHGAAGGTLGTLREQGGPPILRTGPALELCPFAYYAGVRAHRIVVQESTRVRSDLDPIGVLSILDRLNEEWPGYRDTIEKIDEELWPKGPVGSEAVALISRTGAVRWYWWNRESGAMIEAEEPEIEGGVRRDLDRLRAYARTSPEKAFREGDQWSSITFGGRVTVRPKPGGRIIPDAAVMLTAQDRQGMVKRPVEFPDAIAGDDSSE